MAKIKLGNRPKNFKSTVKFPLHEGGEGAIECLFKYRTRTEFGDFIDSMTEAAQLKMPENAEQARFLLREFLDRMVSSNADYLLQVLDGWDVEGAELSIESLRQLADEQPAAANAIMEKYRAVIQDGRLGN